MSLWTTALLSLAILCLAVSLCMVIQGLMQMRNYRDAFRRAWYNADFGIASGLSIPVDDTLHPSDPPRSANVMLQGRWVIDLLSRLQVAANAGEVQPVLPQNGSVRYAGPIWHGTEKPVFGCAYVARGMVVICFRATHNEAERRLDHMVDQTYAASRMLPGHADFDGVGVHTGFWTVFERIRQRVRELMDEAGPDAKIIFAGHSLGGAVAALCGVFAPMLFSRRRGVAVWTFGAPLVGNVRFARAANRLLGSNYNRVENDADVIVHIPFPVMPNFDKPGKEALIYQSAGVPHRFSENHGSLKANHYLGTYVGWMTRQVQENA